MPYIREPDTRWEHDDVHETDADSEYYIEYKCNSCGHVWRTEMPD